ncbi:thiazole synthase [Psychrobacter sanguinis]|uniref:thiazole synthase n=1 Tax=Psychrobacter sanguinis TaxID=861445 RepID=UPI0005C7AD09|nr:thiazole synthase [Psychrobacter sanguinis]MCD9152386.1 thiazole synthase [Psychrobacter sanguinis]
MQTVTEENHSLSSIEPLKNDTFQIGSRTFSSRLLVGTGKYKDLQQTGEAIEASGAEIVTVAIRRTNIGQHSDQPNLLDVISPEKYTILPNTAGCFDADTAIRTCQLARELLDGHNLVKLEVLGDQETLYPNVTQTLIAAQKLIDDGFEVMVYTSDDPIVAKELASMGCVAIMPLGSLIGSGLGLLNPHNLSLIIENTKAQNIPVLVDAGVGAASDAAIAMELGCDGVLMNSAIAHASNPVLMAHAMKHAIWAGRASYIAGRMPKRKMAVPSSPQTGYFFQ